VAALRELPEVDEVGIGSPGPGLRRGIDLVGEHADDDGQLHALHVEEAGLGRLGVVPVQASRRDRGVRQPVHRDVIDDVVLAESFVRSREDARDQLVAGVVVVEHPGGEADR
jgi:hypothetical protein